MSNLFIRQALVKHGLVQEEGAPEGTTAGASISPLPVESEPGDDQPAGPTTEPAAVTGAEIPAPEDNDEIAVIESPDDADDVAEDAAIDADIDEDQCDDETISQLFDRLDTIQLSVAAVDQFGMNPAALAISQSTGLLAGTSLYTMGCENFGTDAELEKQMGLESLASAGEAVVEKLGGKLLARAGGWGTKLIGIVTKSGEAVAKAEAKVAGEAAGAAAKAGTTFGRKAASETGEAAAKGAGRGGVQTALMIAAAIATVGANVTMATRQLPKEASEGAVKGWFGKIRQAIAGIKWPFGKLELRPEPEATGLKGALGKLFCGGKPAKSAESTAAGFIGKSAAWTKEAVASVKGAVARAISSVIEAIKGAGKAFLDVIKGGVNVVDHGAKGAGIGARIGAVREGSSIAGSKTIGLLSKGTYFAGVAAVMAVLAGLVYFVVVGGCRLIKKSFGG